MLPNTNPHSKTPDTENATRKRKKINMIGHGMRIAGADDQCSVPGVTKNVSQQESGECRVSSVSNVQRGDKNCPTAGGDICNNARGMGLGPVAPDGDYQMESVPRVIMSNKV